MAAPPPAATRLETVETGENPVARVSSAGRSARASSRRSRGKKPLADGRYPVLNEALSNAYWQEQGLRSIVGRYHELRGT